MLVGCGLHKSTIEGPCQLNRKGNNSWIPACARMTEGRLLSPGFWYLGQWSTCTMVLGVESGC